ncbi:MAG TPA: cyclopropane-fatty-acyl-phospholipid synthase family protein [Candidatus Limnocylindrales bacterium]|nr:cyclopropane-fatty-acyl-phospholipid synthase family protein [Candidatus Limnocylindrales bacterium]
MTARTVVGRTSVVPDRILEATARRVMLGAARRIGVGRLAVVLPDGSRRVYGDPASAHLGEIRVHDDAAAVRMLFGGEIGAGEAYMDGLWSSPDLPALLRVAALNREALSLPKGWWRLPMQLQKTIAHRTRRNTIAGSRRNIEAHYDLGNDFYRLFLDETLTYSSAVFTSPDQSLADAQRNKYRVIAERAGLRRGDHVLEIGSGWGGFALYAAGELGCRVTSITVSPEQHRLANRRVRDAGLADRVRIELRDYREIEGTYDAIVSIEMLEAVGAEYFTTFFEACDRALRPGGRMSLQVITFPDVSYEPQRRGANWIQTYIFPGGLLPSLAEIERSLHGTQLLVRRADDIAASYVRTLQAWRTAFLARLDDVRALGFDERFIRMWDFYLSISEAGFATGLTQDQQIVLEKGRGIA